MSASRYRARRAEGSCQNCGHEAIKGKTRCTPCGRRNSAKTRRNRPLREACIVWLNGAWRIYRLTSSELDEERQEVVHRCSEFLGAYTSLIAATTSLLAGRSPRAGGAGDEQRSSKSSNNRPGPP